MSRFVSSRIAILSFCLFAGAAVTAAAGQPQAAASSSQDRSAQSQQGPLVVQPISSGGVITPEVLFTNVNHSSATLIGATGGWLYDDSLLLGAGGYWMVNGSHGSGLSYFGFVTGWSVPVGSSLRLGVRGLFGGGDGSFTKTITVPYYPYPDPYHNGSSGNQNLTYVQQQVHIHQGFFVFEPQATAVFNFGSKVALDFGGGYRVIGAAGGWGSELQGGFGRIGVRFGPF